MRVRQFWTWIVVLLVLAAPGVPAAAARDGYRLWLSHRPLAPSRAAEVRRLIGSIEAPEAETDPIVANAVSELRTALTQLAGPARGGGTLLLGTAETPAIAALDLSLHGLGDEGFALRSIRRDGRDIIVIAANRPAGLLYGAFALLRRIEAGASLDALDLRDRPRVDRRVLDHWDNLDGGVERGYAGASIWNWWTLPDWVDPRIADYARANASIGINGAVLNNVNAKADSLTDEWIAKAAAIADVLRPWGMRVYLSARWSAPVDLGATATADPLDPAVAAWWRAKADALYRAIPDFGGFLVKANSEGQPGPQDYGRSHADGANMLAAALAPHGGVVMWRAFVYSDVDPEDRAKQAYSEFRPLDGTFADNVIVQVKNGPIDFQPREPFHPLFGAMPRTPLAIELQITKEYLGQATHLAYLAPLWKEALDADTFADGEGSTVATVIDGSLDRHALTAIAGVANIGRDRNWTGSIFDQANWYAFGRLAWDHRLASEAIAREWAAQSFAPDPGFVEPVVAMMLGSRQAVVDYMTPLGLTHQMATGHHYGPGPWVSDLARPEWNPTYYSRADPDGIGFDRTASGTNAVAQYAPQVAERFADRARVGDDLLWFHHVAWDAQLASGRTLWAELVARYDRGVAAVADMQAIWRGLAPQVGGAIDPERYAEVAAFLGIQHREATWWRDASIAYWQSIHRRPLPPGTRPPPHSLQYYEAIQHPYAPGHPN